MVWVLTSEGIVNTRLQGPSIYSFTGPGNYSVGRKGCDIVINTDKAVSRLHAEFKIAATPPMEIWKDIADITPPSLSIKDFSKLGTFVNKVAGSLPVNCLPEATAILHHGDKIIFGTNQTTFRLSFFPFVLTLTSLLRNTKFQEVSEMAKNSGAYFIPEWSRVCTHIIAEAQDILELSMVNAIGCGQQIVSLNWLQDLHARSSPDMPIPDPSNFSVKAMVPGAGHDGLPATVVVAPPAARSSLLQDTTLFIGPLSDYAAGLDTLVKAAGGRLEQFVSAVPAPSQQHVAVVLPESSDTAPSWLKSKPDLAQKLRRTTAGKVVAAVLSGSMDWSEMTHNPESQAVASGSTEESGGRRELKAELGTAASAGLKDTAESAGRTEDSDRAGKQLSHGVRQRLPNTSRENVVFATSNDPPGNARTELILDKVPARELSTDAARVESPQEDFMELLLSGGCKRRDDACQLQSIRKELTRNGGKRVPLSQSAKVKEGNEDFQGRSILSSELQGMHLPDHRRRHLEEGYTGNSADGNGREMLNLGKASAAGYGEQIGGTLTSGARHIGGQSAGVDFQKGNDEDRIHLVSGRLKKYDSGAAGDESKVEPKMKQELEPVGLPCPEGMAEVVFSSSLIVANHRSQAPVAQSEADASKVPNFKRFRKVQSADGPGNSFTSLVPFAKEPYRARASGSEVDDFLKAEWQRKEKELAADDLFTADKLKRQRATSAALLGTSVGSRKQVTGRGRK